MMITRLARAVSCLCLFHDISRYDIVYLERNERKYLLSRCEVCILYV